MTCISIIDTITKFFKRESSIKEVKILGKNEYIPKIITGYRRAFGSIIHFPGNG